MKCAVIRADNSTLTWWTHSSRFAVNFDAKRQATPMIENPKTRSALQYVCLGLFLLAFALVRHFDDPLTLGLLIGVPPMAVLAWPAVPATFISLAAYGVFFLTLAFSLEGHAGLGLGLVGVLIA